MNPDYTLVIPVLKMEGNPYLGNILSALAGQTHRPQEVHLVVGDRRQGRAINYGVKQAATKYVGTVDDDTQIDDPDLFKKIISAMESDNTIGIAGAACEIPASASPFQQKAMRQIPRRAFPRQKTNVDSDMVQHPCLLMDRQFFLDIGGEDEELIRGLDPVLRKKARDAGKRVVVIADTWIYHLIPDSFTEVVRMYYRNGRGSGFAARNFPSRVLELSDGYDGGSFVEKRPVYYRVMRRLYHLAGALASLQFIRFSTDLAYMAGTLKERISPSYPQSHPAVRAVETSELEGHPFKVIVHKVILDKKGSCDS